MNADREALAAQAEALGLKVHHKAGAAKIQEMIDAHFDEEPTSADLDSSTKFKHPVNPNQVKDGKIVPMTSIEFREKDLPERKKRMGRLVRVRVTCMNPAKREWEGEIISVGSSKHGTFKKYVPFDGREWHVPQIIYDALKERKCTVFHTVTDARGQKIRKGRLIDEFAIEVLPPLTRSELENLKKEQALANNESR